MLTVTVGRGRNRRILEFPALSKAQLTCMTELTQQQMFGEVVHKRPVSRSIHGRAVL